MAANHQGKSSPRLIAQLVYLPPKMCDERSGLTEKSAAMVKPSLFWALPQEFLWSPPSRASPQRKSRRLEGDLRFPSKKDQVRTEPTSLQSRRSKCLYFAPRFLPGNIWLWLKKKHGIPKWLALVSGHMAQNLRFAPPV